MPVASAGQLLTVTDKIIDVGRDLNTLTTCMLDVSASNQSPHMLAWANWANDLTSDVLHACDDLIRAIRCLLGEGEAQAWQGAASKKEGPGHG
jgi:hypothetical protein